MDLYTLDPYFGAADVIDEFISALWAERYAAAGDFTLVVESTPHNRFVLAENKFLALKGTDTVMQIETQTAKDGELTVTGTDLLGFLDQRMFWNYNSLAEEGEQVKDWNIEPGSWTPNQAIAQVVYNMIGDSAMTATGGGNLDWVNEYMPGLVVEYDVLGDTEQMNFTIGPLYTSIKQVAETYGVGMKMFLRTPGSFETPPEIVFTTYLGLDRSSGQEDNELVRFSPQLDNISGISELRSIKEWKNVCYVYYKGVISKHVDLGAYPVAMASEPIGFDRRVLLTNAEGEPPGRKPSLLGTWQKTPGLVNYTVPISDTFEAQYRAQNAKDALANHNYIHSMDGEVSADGKKIGTDYDLGDIIELESPTGLLAQARVTEHIRSEDALGEKEYPTISVIS